MKHTFIILLLLCFFCPNLSAEQFTLKSTNTGDTYTIVVTLPKGYVASKKQYSVIYYPDAGLKSGIAMRDIAPNLMNTNKIPASILVGIKHHGHYKAKRRRDLVQAHQRKGRSGAYYSTNPNYGQSEKFYQFLKKELLPTIENKYRVSTQNRTFCGHSFGGLFTVYSMLHTAPLFDNYLVISPSLWINYQNIFVFEEQYWAKSKAINAKLFICAGDLEGANLVRHNTMVFNTRLKTRKYRGLKYKNKIFARKTHISIIRPALAEGLVYLLGS